MKSLRFTFALVLTAGVLNAQTLVDFKNNNNYSNNEVQQKLAQDNHPPMARFSEADVKEFKVMYLFTNEAGEEAFGTAKVYLPKGSKQPVNVLAYNNTGAQVSFNSNEWNTGLMFAGNGFAVVFPVEDETFSAKDAAKAAVELMEDNLAMDFSNKMFVTASADVQKATMVNADDFMGVPKVAMHPTPETGYQSAYDRIVK